MGKSVINISTRRLSKDLKRNIKLVSKIKNEIANLKDYTLNEIDNAIQSRLSIREAQYYKKHLNITDKPGGLGFSIGFDHTNSLMRRLEYGHNSFRLWSRISPEKAKYTKKDKKPYYDIPIAYYLRIGSKTGSSYNLAPALNFLSQNLRASRFRTLEKPKQYTPYTTTTKRISKRFQGSKFRFDAEMASSWKSSGLEESTGIKANQLLGAAISGTLQTIKKGKNVGGQRMVYTHLVKFRRMSEKNKHLFVIPKRRGAHAISNTSFKLYDKIWSVYITMVRQ